MAIFQCDLRRKNYGVLWNNLFNFFHLIVFDKLVVNIMPILYIQNKI